MAGAVAESLESRSYLNAVAFATPINTSMASLGISPVNVALTNGGDANLITANSNDSVSILLGNADGTFGPPTTIPLDFSPSTIQTGGLSDGPIAVGSDSSNIFGVITDRSTERDYSTTLANTESIAMGDFNADGNPDIAIASDDGGISNNVAIFLSNGSGVFAQSQILSVTFPDLASITTYTVGNTTDLAVADPANNQITTLINNGSGTFTIGSNYPVGPDPVAVTSGFFDTNTDGEDLVTANATGGSVSVLPGNGDGTFGSAINSILEGTPSGCGPLTLGLANLNTDNIYDSDLICLLSPGSSGNAEALQCNNDGTFQVASVISIPNMTPTSIGVGDLNGDGFTDMVLANENEVSSLINISQDPGPSASTQYYDQLPVTAGAATIDFDVTYTGIEWVDPSTLGDNNLTVTTPFGKSVAATLVSTNLAPSRFVTATYSIAAGSVTPADDGIYTLVATSNSADAVKDVSGFAIEDRQIGQFLVMLPVEGQSEANLVVSRVAVNNPATAFMDRRFTGTTRVTIVNSGNAKAQGNIVIDLYASPAEAIPEGVGPLVSVTRGINLKPGGKVVEALPGFYWPETSGKNFLVADVDATETIPETLYGDNYAMSAKSSDVVMAIVDIDNLWSGRLPANLRVGRRTSLAVMLKNLGNTAAHAGASSTIQAEDADGNLTTVGTGTIHIGAAPGGRDLVRLPLTLPTTLSTGSYHLIVTVNYDFDTNASNNSAVSATTFGI